MSLSYIPGSLLREALDRQAASDALPRRTPGKALRESLPAPIHAQRHVIEDVLAGDRIPTLAESLDAINGYAWHPWWEDAHAAIEAAWLAWGDLEAAARATEILDTFRAMCDARPWGWLG